MDRTIKINLSANELTQQLQKRRWISKNKIMTGAPNRAPVPAEAPAGRNNRMTMENMQPDATVKSGAIPTGINKNVRASDLCSAWGHDDEENFL